jgi:homoserine O-succinyltransferase
VKNGLPAVQTLERENIFVMTHRRAAHQDIRPLEIAIVNLMPTKVATETQLIRLLSNSPLQVNVTLVAMSGYLPKNTSQQHMDTFYVPSEQVLKRRFDGLIVTGAPLEATPFEEVDYWEELKAILAWARRNVFSSLFICWGVNAALYYYYGIERHLLRKKLFGVYPVALRDKTSHLLRGFDDPWLVPQSRYMTVLPEDLEGTGLRVLAASRKCGAVVFSSANHRQAYITGHLEYDGTTLDREYKRDRKAGISIDPPFNYYPADDPRRHPMMRWRTYAHQFYSNWLNHYVYQETPFDLTRLR